MIFEPQGDLVTGAEHILGFAVLVQQGGIVVDEKKVESIDESIPQEKFAGDGIIIRKGKKVFHKAVTK